MTDRRNLYRTAHVDHYEQYADQSMSFTDVMTVAFVDFHEIDGVLSFDDDFDGICNRLEPETVR